jgi:hypothetical protein
VRFDLERPEAATRELLSPPGASRRSGAGPGAAPGRRR